MNESFQHIQPGAAGSRQGLPVSRRFPRLPWWLGQILPAPRSRVGPPGSRGAPLSRALAPVAPQADRSPPVASLPDRPPGRGEARRMLEARGGKREKHRGKVLNTQSDTRRYGAPLPTASMPLANSIMPLSPVLPASRAWRSIQVGQPTLPNELAGLVAALDAEAEFKSQPGSRSPTIVPSQPPHPQLELESDRHREYSIELAR